jgi:osmoprotectant transport system ATP-binding protein
MIELDRVAFETGGKRIVDDVSFTVAAGEFCALVGPSGSGKSTTLRLVNRLIPLSAGAIRIAGEDVAATAPERLRRSIGYVIQSIGLFPHWTVADNIATVPRLLGWPTDRRRARVEELLQLLRLDHDVAEKHPHQLSGGQQQRVGVARALAADPDILLMDEPFGALDPITRAALQGELRQIHRRLGKTILFVTHDIDEALKLADSVAILEGGRLAQFGAPIEILERPASTFVRTLIGADEIGLRRLSLGRVAERMRDPDGGAGEPIDANDSLRDALSQMIARHADRLPVRGTDGTIVGSIGLRDLLR